MCTYFHHNTEVLTEPSSWWLHQGSAGTTRLHHEHCWRAERTAAHKSAQKEARRVSHCLPGSSDPSDFPISLHLALFSVHLFSILLVPILPAPTTLKVWFKQNITTPIPPVPFQLDLSGQQNKHSHCPPGDKDSSPYNITQVMLFLLVSPIRLLLLGPGTEKRCLYFKSKRKKGSIKPSKYFLK